MSNLNAYVTREEAYQIINTAYTTYKDRELTKAYPETYGLFFEALWATGIRISEAVGGKGYDKLMCRNRVIKGIMGNCPKHRAKGLRACVNCKECRVNHYKKHYGIRVRDLLDDATIAIYGKNTAGTKLKQRTVFCDREVFDKLVKYAEKYRLGYDDRLFPVSDCTIQDKVIPRIRSRLNPDKLKHFTCHWFRHGHAIYLVRNDVDLLTIARQLGHEKLEITAGYLRFRDDYRQQFDKAFGIEKRPDYVKIRCPKCGLAFRLKKNREINLEDRIRAVLPYTNRKY